MTREQLLDRVPPCGLMCYTCPGFTDGAIAGHSAALLKLNVGYREFLDEHLPNEYRHVLGEQDKYIERLKKDSSPNCPGCRKIDGKWRGCIEGCFIPGCTSEHSVDFCGECEDFPCSRIEESAIYRKEVKKGFYEGSSLIKKHGAEKFFEMRSGISHYMSFVKE